MQQRVRLLLLVCALGSAVTFAEKKKRLPSRVPSEVSGDASAEMELPAGKAASPEDENAPKDENSDQPVAKKKSKTPVMEALKNVDTPLEDWIVPELPISTPDDVAYRRLEKSLSIRQKSIEEPWPLPATSLATPAGYGAEWTDVFAGSNIQFRSRYSSAFRLSGTHSVGFGLGNAAKYVGLETTITSFGSQPPFGEGNGITFKLHHFFKDSSALGIGWEYAILIGDSDASPSYYIVYSRPFPLKKKETDWFSLVVAHAGLGDGRFSSLQSISEQRVSVNFFAAVGIRVLQPLTYVLNYSGQEFVTGVSVTPFRRFPLSLSAIVSDLTSVAGSPRFALSIAWGDSWKSPTFPFLGARNSR